MRASNQYESNTPRQNASGVSVRDGLTYLAVGGGIGAALALLFAPKSGREMRHDIADASRRGYDLTREKVDTLKSQSVQTLNKVKEKAGSAYGFASSHLKSGQDIIDDASKAASLPGITGTTGETQDTDIRSGHASTGRKPASIF